MYLYGASGHGKVIKEILEEMGIVVDGFIDDKQSTEWHCGLRVHHDLNVVDEIIISIGANQDRKKIVEQINCKFSKPAIHPSAIISKTATIDCGSVVMAGAIINADAKVGKHCIINTGVSVDHESIIEDYVHVAPQVSLCANVRVGEGTLVGVGSCVIPNIKIGKWSVIGAGSVVVSDIPDGVIAYGNPCRIIKKIKI